MNKSISHLDRPPNRNIEPKKGRPSSYEEHGDLCRLSGLNQIPRYHDLQQLAGQKRLGEA